jgi:hypothetical protein
MSAVSVTHLNIMEVDSPQRPSPMTDNTTAGNIIEIMSSPAQPVLKRKGEERARHEGKENGDDKRVKLDCTYTNLTSEQNTDSVAISSGPNKALVELKGKKLVYKEDAAPWSIPKRRELRIMWIENYIDRQAYFAFLLFCSRLRKKARSLPSFRASITIL